MSTSEKKEHAAIEKMVNRKSSKAYLSARRANVPVTIVRGDTICRETRGESVIVGKVPPMVKVTRKVVVLK